MNIPVIRSSMPPYEEYCEEIKELWTSCWLTNMGIKHRQLQLKLGEYLGAAQIDLLANGHMALELALQALGLHGEVITTPFTFASTTQAIVRSGLTPVFCDIDPLDFTIDSSKIETLITENTCAVMPVHTYGNVCAVEKIEHIANKHGLKVVYDAAHAFGVRYKGIGVSTYGDVSCLSFHATKVFHTIEGGAVCFRDKAFGERLARLKNFGLDGSEVVSEIGANAKMDEFRAAMGLCNLRYVEGEIAQRKIIAKEYRTYLEGIPGIQLAPIQDGVQSNYAYFPVVFNKDIFGASRDDVLAVLGSNGVMARKYFYPLTSSFACYHGRYNPESTPIALQISQSILTLPLYADMSSEMVEHICKIVLSCRK